MRCSAQVAPSMCPEDSALQLHVFSQNIPPVRRRLHESRHKCSELGNVLAGTRHREERHKNLTGASTVTVLRIKWVKFQFLGEPSLLTVCSLPPAPLTRAAEDHLGPHAGAGPPSVQRLGQRQPAQLNLHGREPSRAWGGHGATGHRV